ncbi:SNF2 family DNA-dependent ATPase [Auriculariales sp. MPI-PUGE-AT-0066]|nr:SNF2 family DNA-dependent ATPase [Auriculariales sp. MPI-PUGE-AT-0066]
MAEPEIAVLDPMEEDKLSDVVPMSKLASRAASTDGEPSRDHTESELSEVDELASEDDDEAPAPKAKPQKKSGAPKGKKLTRKERDEELKQRRAEMDRARAADALKRYSFLLGQTELFQHFVDLKAREEKERDPEYAKILEQQHEQGKGRGRKKAADKTARHRKSEKEEDDELLRETNREDEDDDQPYVFEESPAFVKGGKMREYQIQGLNWMVSLHHNGMNGILADEMGLGKTLQTISFLGYLRHIRGIRGPHLVVVPKSTLQNWAREFEKWTPDVNIVVLTGTREERAQIIAERIITNDFDVCITTYELCIIEKGSLRKLSFEYIIIDEAHRIKNMDSILSQIVRMFLSRGRMLITGTPLQNNLQELFALLNFICPEIFSDYGDLESFLHKGDKEDMSDEDASKVVVQALHKILRPFLLRRVKSDVEKSLLPKKEINIYVGLTDMQRKWYRSVLEKDIDAVNGLTGKKEGKTRLMNVVMQLRKVSCHPYLFDGAEPGPPYTTGEHLIENCGKMVILDKLLMAMKAKGSRVLIFSQMSRVLDILEDYCLYREYQYCRIDGGTQHEDRISSIDEYNRPGSEKFIFLLTTRAGGLGINLTSADIVVLYDSDWNPQADLQAMDRAHRIGQTKQVYVYRFITEDSVEERMLERAAQKLRLDQLVIQQGRSNPAQKGAGKDELLDMIHHGAEKIVNAKDSLLHDEAIEEIIKRGEQRTAELNSKYEELNFDDLSNFKTESMAVQTWEGEDFGRRKQLKGLWIEPTKRERKGNYSIDKYYQELNMRSAPTKVDKIPRAIRLPKQPCRLQFASPRLSELQAKEMLWAKKQAEWKVPLREPAGEADTPEVLDAERQTEQDQIDSAEVFTEEDDAEMRQLEGEAFLMWNRRDFQQFVKGVEKHGRDTSAELLAQEIDGKDAKEVALYAKVFWLKWHTLPEYERTKQRIEEGQAKRDKDFESADMLRRKIAMYRYPMQELHLNYPTTKGKIYSEEEDRYLLCRLDYYGLNSENVYERIKKDVSEFPVFRFDWFFKSRTVIELERRSKTLLLMIAKEQDEGKGKSKEKEDKAAPKGKKTLGKRTFDEAGLDDTSRASTPKAVASKKSTPSATTSKKQRKV